MPKPTIREIRQQQYLRAARVLVEKVLSYDTNTSWTVAEIAECGMIRKRYIRQAAKDSPKVKPYPTKSGPKRYIYSGTKLAINPQALGVDPQKLKRKKK